MEPTIPVVVLCGSDLRSPRLPDSGRGAHPLVAHKGAAVRLGGRPLVSVVLERLAESGAFDPLIVAGPARVYAGLTDRAEIVDTDSNFGANIRAAVEHVRRIAPGHPVAFTTCDIVPTIDDLREAIAAWRAEGPCDLWSALVRVPQNRRLLGASAWKPAYRVVPRHGDEPIAILPGHLTIADPEALRLRFVYDLFDRGYRLRNRSVVGRVVLMPAGLLAAILWQDVLHVASGRLPTLTLDTVGSGIVTGMRLARGRASLIELGAASRRIFVKRRHRAAWPERRVVLSVVDGLSLALDIDTEEELEAHGATLEGGAAGSDVALPRR